MSKEKEIKMPNMWKSFLVMLGLLLVIGFFISSSKTDSSELGERFGQMIMPLLLLLIGYKIGLNYFRKKNKKTRSINQLSLNSK